MKTFSLQVNIGPGTLSIDFDSVAELEKCLSSLDAKALETVLQTHLKSIAVTEPRKVKPALDGICGFRPDGTLELYVPATSKVEAIGVILYAYDPDPVGLETLGSLTSEKNPAAYLGQKQYTKLFHKVRPGFYTLAQDGKVWVASTVIPKLRKES